MANQDLSIEKGFEEAHTIFKSTKLIMAFSGTWPLDRTRFIYLIWVILYTINGIWGWAFLIENHNDLIIMSANVSEMMTVVAIELKVLHSRFSRYLPDLLSTVQNNMQSVHFRSDEESKIYLEYILKGKAMSRFTLDFIGVITLIYYLKPIAIITTSAFVNSSNIIFELPYSVEPFLDYTQFRFFIIVYSIQSCCLVMNSVFACNFALFYMIGFHCSGELAVLQYRIRQIGTTMNVDKKPTNLDTTFKDLIGYHVQIIDLARDIDVAYQATLLQELITMTGILALTSYASIMNLDEPTIFVSCIGVSSGATLILYGNCLIGEALATESLKVCEAFYDSKWYNLPEKRQKLLTICIARTIKPFQLTAGGYFVYSMASFAAILKSAMAYLSMLRSMN